MQPHGQKDELEKQTNNGRSLWESKEETADWRGDRADRPGGTCPAPRPRGRSPGALRPRTRGAWRARTPAGPAAWGAQGRAPEPRWGTPACDTQSFSHEFAHRHGSEILQDCVWPTAEQLDMFDAGWDFYFDTQKVQHLQLWLQNSRLCLALTPWLPAPDSFHSLHLDPQVALSANC